MIRDPFEKVPFLTGPELGRVEDTIARRWIPRGAWFVFGASAALVALVRIEGGGGPWSWYAVAFLLVAPLVLHRASQRAAVPWTVVKRELIVAAFLQGVCAGFLDFRPMPLLAVLGPIAAFVLVGGVRQLVLGAVAVGSGAALAGVFLEPATTPTGPGTLWASAIMLLLAQVQIVGMVIYNDYRVLAAYQSPISPARIDAATGLRTREFFEDYLRERCAAIVASRRDPGQAALPDLLFLTVVFEPVRDLDRVLSVVAHDLLEQLPEGAVLVRAGETELRAAVAIRDRDQAGDAADRYLALARASAERCGAEPASVAAGGAVFPFLPPRPDLFPAAEVTDFARRAADHARRKATPTPVLIEPGSAYGRDHFTSKVVAAGGFEDLLDAGVISRVR